MMLVHADLAPGEEFRVTRAPDGSTTVTIAPGSAFGDMVRDLAVNWRHRTLVGQAHRIAADRAGDIAAMVEQRIARALLVSAADEGLVPLSLPRPEWRLAEQGQPFVPGVTATDPGDVAECHVEVVAIPMPPSEEGIR